ncbi:hypothetical protein ES703_90996 [subsurface metagenome]
MSLNSKERMQLIMNHKEPDRVPYQVTFGAPSMGTRLVVKVHYGG